MNQLEKLWNEFVICATNLVHIQDPIWGWNAEPTASQQTLSESAWNSSRHAVIPGIFVRSTKTHCSTQLPSALLHGFFYILFFSWNLESLNLISPGSSPWFLLTVFCCLRILAHFHYLYRFHLFVKNTLFLWYPVQTTIPSWPFLFKFKFARF